MAFFTSQNFSVTNLSNAALDMFRDLSKNLAGFADIAVILQHYVKFIDLNSVELGWDSFQDFGAITKTVSLVCICGLGMYIWISKTKEHRSTLSKEQLISLLKEAYIPGNAEQAKHQIEIKRLDVNEIVSFMNLTYFLCACLSGNGDLVDYMMKKGANVHSETTEGDSALYLATFAVLNLNADNFDVLQVLINAGCNVNHQNKRGFTPLHRAASKGNCKVIKFLLQHGATPDVANTAGVYPIDSAVCAGHKEAANLLKIELPNPYVWDVIEPHTPPHITLGLLSPNRREVLQSTRRQVFERVFKGRNKGTPRKSSTSQ